MKPNRDESQNSNIVNGSASATKKFTAAMLFTGIFVAISFIIQLIPLAVFNVAQVAAILGKRAALLLMIAVAVLFFMLSSLFGALFAANGIIVLFAIPFFILAIFVREKKKHWLYAAAIMLAPVVLFFYSIIFTADKSKFDSVMNGEVAVSQSETKDKPTLLDSQTLASSTASSNETKSISNNSISVNYLDNLDNPRHLFEKLKQENPEGFKVLAEFLNYEPWQRILFFVFGSGSIFMLVALLIAFANVVFVDFGFEQIERLRAIVNYVRRNSHSFATQLVNSLFALPMVNTKKTATPFLISQHKGQNSETLEGRNFSPLSIFWKPPKLKNTIYWQGYIFPFQGKSPWNLREFLLPFPLVIGAVASLAAMGIWFENFDAMLTALQHSQYAMVLASLSLISLILLSIVALQGMFTLYKRLTTIVSLLLMIVVMSLMGNNLIGSFEILGFFGAVGLLDYVYDWRGIKSRNG